MTQIVQPHPPESGPSTDQVDVDAPHGVHEIASIRRRVLAAIVDWTIAVAMGALLGYVLLGVYFRWVSAEAPTGQLALGVVIILPPLTYVCSTIIHLLFAYWIGARGYTPGDRLLGLRVQRVDGGRVGRGRGLLRGLTGSPCLLVPYLMVVLGIIIELIVFDRYISRDSVSNFWGLVISASVVGMLLVGVANHLWMLLDAKNRGLHDLMVDTVVVRLRRERSWTDGHRQNCRLCSVFGFDAWT